MSSIAAAVAVQALVGVVTVSTQKH